MLSVTWSQPHFVQIMETSLRQNVKNRIIFFYKHDQSFWQGVYLADFLIFSEFVVIMPFLSSRVTGRENENGIDFVMIIRMEGL
ncbi:MAG: hypothetical protein EOL86_07505 [Deltaproteobacteria bacterium]|nr:hypothetical protein [Deltaproteobacteria bacterium]